MRAHQGEPDGLQERNELGRGAAVITREFDLAKTRLVHLAQGPFEVLRGLGFHRPELDSRGDLPAVMRGERATQYGSGRDARSRGHEKRTSAQHGRPLCLLTPAHPARRPDAGSLLDVACGPGFVSEAAAARGARPVGVDVAAAMVERARARCPDLAFVVGDALRLPFPDASFDAVTINFGILHLSRPELALSEARRVLVHKGRFAFTAWVAEGNAVSEIVDTAVAENAVPVELPEGPGFYRFADEDESQRALAEAKEAAQVDRLPLTVADQRERPQHAAAAGMRDDADAPAAAIVITSETTPKDLARAAFLAQGGEKFRSVQNMILRGSVQLYPPNSVQSIPGGFSLITAGDKLRMEIDARPAITFKQIYNGEQTYSSMPNVAVPPLTKFGFGALARFDQPGYQISAIADKKKQRGFRLVDPDGVRHASIAVQHVHIGHLDGAARVHHQDAARERGNGRAARREGLAERRQLRAGQHRRRLAALRPGRRHHECRWSHPRGRCRQRARQHRIWCSSRSATRTPWPAGSASCTSSGTTSGRSSPRAWGSTPWTSGR